MTGMGFASFLLCITIFTLFLSCVVPFLIQQTVAVPEDHIQRYKRGIDAVECERHIEKPVVADIYIHLQDLPYDSAGIAEPDKNFEDNAFSFRCAGTP